MSSHRIVNKIKELLFKNQGTRQTIVKNVFWLSFSQIAGRFIRAFIIIYAARILGATDYGVFSYALGLAGFFTIFADIGINAILTREAAQKTEQRSQYFITALWLKLFLLLLTGLAILIIAPHFSKISAANILIPFIALLTFFDGIREFSTAFLRAFEKMEYEALISFITNISITATGFVILAVSPTVQALTISYVASAGVGALISIVILRKEYRKLFSAFDKNLVRPIIRSALPIVLISLFGAFMLNTDMVLLGWWRGPTELGYYSAAQKIVQVLYTLPGILASAFFPTISRLIGQKRDEEINILTERSLTTIFFVAIPLVIGGMVLAKPIIIFLYGVTYLPAVLTFQILIATVIPVFANAPLSNLVVAYDKQKKAIWPILASNLSNIVFDIVLIPRFGIEGSAVATIIAQSVSLFFMWRLVRQTNHFKIVKHLTRIAPAALIMGGIAFILNALNTPLLVNIALSGISYFGMLYIMKEHVIEEIKSILKIARS